MSKSSVVGIKSFGVCVPRRRIPRAAIAAAHAWALPGLKGLAKGEKAFCNWDEDAITLGVEAGRDCLRGNASASVSGLIFASTTAPYADLQNASIVAAALRMPPECASADLGGAVRAGLTGLAQAIAASSDGDHLVVAAERRRAKAGSAQEMLYGSAAGAILVGSGKDVIARFLGRESLTVPFIDHFRQQGERYDYFWEERWIRDEGVSRLVPKAVGALLERLNLTPNRVAHFGMAGGPPGSDKLVAKAMNIPAERILPDLQGQIGDSGAAHPLLQLAAALEKAEPGDVIVVTSFSQGCEVLAFEMLDLPRATGRQGLAASLSNRIEESAYLKMLSFDDGIEIDWGMRAETDNKTALTQLYRSSDQIFGFVGGKCDACSTIQFPRMPVCVNCGGIDSQKPYGLAEQTAKVATYTADWLQYSPAPPLYLGLVQFDIGARLFMEITDVGKEGIDVGTPLSMAFRMKERDRLRHFDRYFWKAVPTRTEKEA